MKLLCSSIISLSFTAVAAYDLGIPCPCGRVPATPCVDISCNALTLTCHVDLKPMRLCDDTYFPCATGACFKCNTCPSPAELRTTTPTPTQASMPTPKPTPPPTDPPSPAPKPPTEPPSPTPKQPTPQTPTSPTGQTPTGGTPTGLVPTGRVPTGGTAPTGGTPTGGTPTEGTPTGGTPTGGTPTGGTPTGGTPTGGGPTGGGGSNPDCTGSGDPHFKSWDGIRFNYHGVCDLVMLHSDEFGNGLGLDVHIRTKLVWDLYTHIERAAVKIGDNVFEVMNDKHWFNGEEGVDLPLSLSGFNVSLHDAPPNSKLTDSYVINLKSGARIVIGAFQNYMSVHVFGGKGRDRMPDAIGLLGNKQTGEFLGRDGVTKYTLDTIDDYGSEWRVREDEPRLFVDGEPRQKCYIASKESAHTTGRKLSQVDPDLAEAAEEACGVHFDHPDDVDACVFDVMVTGDFELAEAHGQMHQFAHGFNEFD